MYIKKLMQMAEMAALKEQEASLLPTYRYLDFNYTETILLPKGYGEMYANFERAILEHNMTKLKSPATQTDLGK
jgi:hypothetical protein